MTKKIYKTNEEMLQNAQVLFETIEKNQDIAQKLEDYGYPTAEIAKGKKLYTTAQTLYGTNKKETEEERIAYQKFSSAMDELTKTYAEHRNKAKLIFKENETAKISLALKGSPATAITTLLEEITQFYKNLHEQEALRTPLIRVKITTENITDQQAKTSQVKNLYSTYAQEKNESQQATKYKNKAFADLDKWTRELYAYAKYALAEHSQFLQIFGKTVK